MQPEAQADAGAFQKDSRRTRTQNPETYDRQPIKAHRTAHPALSCRQAASAWSRINHKHHSTSLPRTRGRGPRLSPIK